MPIRYVETRWCSWLEAVLYFTQHLHREAVKKAMKDILETDPKSDSAKSVLVLLRDKEVEDGIKFIQENFISFGKLIRLCEKQDTTLEEAVEKIESMNFEYNNELSMPDIFKDKFDEIFAKNNGFQAVLKLINGEKTDNFVNMTEEECGLVKKGPSASSDAERCFSTVTCVLRPNRNKFKVDSLCMHIVINKYLNSRLKVKMIDFISYHCFYYLLYFLSFYIFSIFQTIKISAKERKEIFCIQRRNRR